jgi:hypothetical protein
VTSNLPETLVTLRGAFKDGADHAAPWEKPRAGEYPVSHQSNLPEDQNSHIATGSYERDESRSGVDPKRRANAVGGADSGARASHQGAAAHDGDVVRLTAGSPNTRKAA